MKMFNNLTKEIITLAVIPVIVILIVDLIFVLVFRNKNESFRYNYLIKISLIIAIAIVLPLITGYTIWVIESFTNRGILMDNMWYIILIIFLTLALLVLLIWIYLKSLRNLIYEEIDEEENKDKKNTVEAS